MACCLLDSLKWLESRWMCSTSLAYCHSEKASLCVVETDSPCERRAARACGDIYHSYLRLAAIHVEPPMQFGGLNRKRGTNPAGQGSHLQELESPDLQPYAVRIKCSSE
jgi:hypothetical protein